MYRIDQQAAYAVIIGIAIAATILFSLWVVIAIYDLSDNGPDML